MSSVLSDSIISTPENADAMRIERLRIRICSGKLRKIRRKKTYQRRDKYFLCMYCIHYISKITFTLTFSEISDLYFFVGRLEPAGGRYYRV